MANLIHDWAVGVATLSLPMAVLLPLEVLAPRGPPTWRSRLRGFSIYALIWVPAGMLFGFLMARFLPPTHPIVSSKLWAGHPWLALAATLVVYDLGFYVMHRVQHRFFWRWHAVHHSIENLGAVNSCNHPSQLVFEWAGIVLPMALLGIGPGFILGSLATLQGLYLHTSTRLNLGPLRWLLNDNRHHRIHHSREPEHFDKNFSLFFPFWDMVFGTAHMHEPEAWPATGVQGLPEAKTLAGFLAQPLRKKR